LEKSKIRNLEDPLKSEVYQKTLSNLFSDRGSFILSFTQKKLLEFLQNGPATRRTICNKTGIKWTTAYDNLRILKEHNLVFKFKDPNHNGSGAPLRFWKIKEKED